MTHREPEPFYIFGAGMKNKLSVIDAVRLWSALFAVLSAVLQLLPDLSVLPVSAVPQACSAAFLCSSCLLFLCPVQGEDARRPLAVLLLVSAVLATLLILRAPPVAIALAGVIPVFASLIVKVLRKYRVVPLLFQHSSVWTGVVEYFTLMHFAVWLSLWLLVLALYDTGAGSWACLPPVLAFYSVQLIRVKKGNTMFLGEAKETVIRKSQREAAARKPIEYVDADTDSARLFNKVVGIMETEKPFLQDDFSVDDLARMTGTNRLYLSRSLNLYSGRNFNQLLNYYRINYAMELIKRDPRLKIGDLSQMSGFHSVVTFNMAFKLNANMTPGQMMRSLASKKQKEERWLTGPSRKQAQAP